MQIPSCSSYRAQAVNDVYSDSSASPSTSGAQKSDRKSFTKRNYRRRSRTISSSSDEVDPANLAVNEAKRIKSENKTTNNPPNIVNEESPPPEAGQVVGSDEDLGISDVEVNSSSSDSSR